MRDDDIGPSVTNGHGVHKNGDDELVGVGLYEGQGFVGIIRVHLVIGAHDLIWRPISD